MFLFLCCGLNHSTTPSTTHAHHSCTPLMHTTHAHHFSSFLQFKTTVLYKALLLIRYSSSSIRLDPCRSLHLQMVVALSFPSILLQYYRRESRVPFPDSRISRQTDKEETNTVQVTSRPDLRLSEVVKRVLKVDVGANTLTQRPVVNSCKLQETARSTNPLKSNDNP